MRVNAFLAGAVAAILLAAAAPAHALGPSSEVRVLAPETYPVGQPFPPDRPASAFNTVRNEFLAVGEGAGPASGNGIFARRTLADGSPVGPITRIADRALGFEDIAAVAHDSEHDDYLVAWGDRVDRDDPNSAHAVFAQRLDGDATKLGDRFMVSSASSWARQPAIAYDASRGRYLVAWANAIGQDVIVARTVGPDDTMGPERNVSLEGSYSQEFPEVARDEEDDTFLVTWSGSTTPPGQTHFYAQLLDGDGAHADAGPDLKISEGQGLGGTVTRPSGLTYNPVEGEFLAAFPQVGLHGRSEIAVQRIGPDGSKVVGSSNAVLPEEGNNPRVSYGGGRYLVTFGSFAKPGSTWISVTRGTLLDGHADPLPGQSDARLSECTQDTALSYGAGRWMLAWYGGGRSTGEDTALLDLRSQTATADAAPSTATTCPSSPAEGPGPEPTDGAPAGPSAGADEPQRPPGSPLADPDGLQPRIVSAAVRRRARRLDLIVRTSEEARLSVVLERRKIGRRSGKRCRAVTRRTRGVPRCIRRVAAGRLSTTAGPDARRLALGKLPAGSYSATLVAVDAAGNESAPVRVHFRSRG